MLLKGGSIRHIESEGNVVRDNTGNISKVVVVSRDVTSRKLAEAALQESEQRSRAIFENAPIGIARVSLTRQFLQINEVYCKIVGYSPEEMLSPQFNLQQITFPEDRETNMALVKRPLNGENSSAHRQALKERPEVLAVARQLLEIIVAYLRAADNVSIFANIRGESPKSIAAKMFGKSVIGGLQGPKIPR